jgi:hypothetical protein
MPVTLTIHAESVEEFDTFLQRFSRSGATAAIMPEIAHTPAAQEAVAAAEPAKGKGRTNQKKTEEPVATTDTSTTAGVGTSVTTDASRSETVTAAPSASSPADAAAAEAGEVTIQQLKDAMADLLKAKSASFAMQTLEAATGCKSLTSGSPSVVEKAKDDPTIMRTTLDALVAAKTAA